MSSERSLSEAEKHGPRSLGASSPSSSIAATETLAATRSPSSSSVRSSRTSPVTRLRYRQMVQPITPTELEPVPDAEKTTMAGKAIETGSDSPSSSSVLMRYPQVELSSLDLAKPRIYTRLLYFFEVAANNPSSASHQESVIDPSVNRPLTPISTETQKKSSKSRHHYHYHQSPFMDPMLLQASLALVLSDFFPLAGRLCNSNQQSTSSCGSQSSSASVTDQKHPFIECNDHGVLFAVADTTTTMQRIRQGEYQDTVLPPRLFPVGLYPASLRDPPLLNIQLTYTQDHSLIMGVAMDSSVMDAASLVSFMDAWSKITQGKDFSPYPILDRSFLETQEDQATNAIYRHQRINNSPPPPILFDNNLDQDLDRGLVDSDLSTEDDEDMEDDYNQDNEQGSDQELHDKEDTTRPRFNLEAVQKQMLSIQQGLDSSDTESTALKSAGVPKVIVDHAGRLEDPVEDISEVEDIEMEQERRNLHLFHFTTEQLDRIKKLASEQNIAAAACAADDKEISDKWVSTGDSLIAYLWKMSTITRRMEPDCKLMCGLVIDIRDRITPKVPEGFIGNAIMSICVQMPVHSLLTTPLSLPSRLLRDELLLQTPEQIRSAISWIQKQDHPHLIETTSNNPFGHDFMVWSFRKLNMYSPDFGQGRPAKVRIGQGGFGGGEGMCIIMDSEPPRAQNDRNAIGAGSSSDHGDEGLDEAGVDVYLGLQGEHLQDFVKVHQGFMHGLLEPSAGVPASEWEVV
ncbi:hypothetical protein BG011_006732 [Mortierella polycephala]|uniref:Transferase n=1 Tax=Mortierella polycephala TaxID=41804 RepID=A0A9P6TYK8_9FUNG|nr:hypothetical protein BG011_006732 [Mortierella polycephala]